MAPPFPPQPSRGARRHRFLFISHQRVHGFLPPPSSLAPRTSSRPYHPRPPPPPLLAVVGRQAQAGQNHRQISYHRHCRHRRSPSCTLPNLPPPRRRFPMQTAHAPPTHLVHRPPPIWSHPLRPRGSPPTPPAPPRPHRRPHRPRLLRHIQCSHLCGTHRHLSSH